MKHIFLISFIILGSLFCRAQDNDHLYMEFGYLSANFAIVEPVDSSVYVLNQYMQIKWMMLMRTDTLEKLSDGSFVGDSIKIAKKRRKYYMIEKGSTRVPRRKAFKEVSYCSEEVSYVKNAIIWDSSRDKVHCDSLYGLIGRSHPYFYTWDSQAYNNNLIIETCPDQYQAYFDSIVKLGYEEIDKIYCKKLELQLHFENNLEECDEYDITGFLMQFYGSVLDFEILEFILLNRPDLFYETIDNIDDYTFEKFMHGIGYIFIRFNFNTIIEILEEKETNSKRIHELTKELKITRRLQPAFILKQA